MRGARRGSMQLSIEAIIILVIAMVLLALGIAFIQGFFREAEGTVKQVFVVGDDLKKLGCNPNADAPIKVVPANIDVKSGGEEELTACVYSVNGVNDVSVVVVKCDTNTGDTGERPITLVSSANIPGGQAYAFPMTLTAKKLSDVTANLASGTYICTFEAQVGGVSLASTQVVLKVTS